MYNEEQLQDPQVRIAQALEVIAGVLVNGGRGAEQPEEGEPSEEDVLSASTTLSWAIALLDEQYKAEGQSWNVGTVAGWHAATQFLKAVLEEQTGEQLAQLEDLIRRVLIAREDEISANEYAANTEPQEGGN